MKTDIEIIRDECRKHFGICEDGCAFADGVYNTCLVINNSAINPELWDTDEINNRIKKLRKGSE